MTTYERVYDGLEDMVAAADAGVQAGRSTRTVASPARHPDFIGRQFANWTDIKAAFQEAWQEGLDEVQYMLFELRKVTLPPVTCQKRRARFADEGDEVDSDRLRAGQEAWRTMRRDDVQGPQSFSVIADMSTLGDVDAKDILWRGAVAIVLADLLEEQGHRVEVWAACRQTRCYEGNGGNFQAVCLKRADQPLDISSLTNAVSGWSYRTLFFQDRMAEKRATCRETMGTSIGVRKDDELVAALVGSNAKTIVVTNIWSKEAATAFAARTIETINQ